MRSSGRAAQRPPVLCGESRARRYREAHREKDSPAYPYAYSADFQALEDRSDSNRPPYATFTPVGVRLCLRRRSPLAAQLRWMHAALASANGHAELHTYTPHPPSKAHPQARTFQPLGMAGITTPAGRDTPGGSAGRLGAGDGCVGRRARLASAAAASAALRSAAAAAAALSAATVAPTPATRAVGETVTTHRVASYRRLLCTHSTADIDNAHPERAEVGAVYARLGSCESGG
jgi:hypothetical protein